MTIITLDIGSVVTFSLFTTGCHMLSCRPFFYNKATPLLSLFILYLGLGCYQPDAVQTSTCPQICNRSWSCRTSILEGATFHRIGASSFEEIPPGPSKHSPTGTPSSGKLQVLDALFSFSPSVVWKNSETDSTVSTLHAYSYRDGNCNCVLSHIARWFPIANHLQEFFVHAVLSLDSWPRRSSQNFRFWPQSSYFEFLAPYFFSP